jgi:type II secretory pathway pseudopilin PulG
LQTVAGRAKFHSPISIAAQPGVLSITRRGSWNNQRLGDRQMRSTHHRHGFIGINLIEILIVLIVIGVLAGVVIPKFLDTALGASSTNIRIQLNTIRTQVELYQLRNGGRMPNLITRQWDDLLNDNLICSAPRNPMQNDSTLVASEPAPGVGWVWDRGQIYAVDQDGRNLIQ